MPMICPTGNAQLVPQADASGEAALHPAVTDVPTNGFSIPVSVANVEAVTVSVDPSANTPTSTAEVYARPNDSGAWRLIDTLDIAAGAANARYNCPIGQIRVKILVVATAKVFVQGLHANK